RPYHLALPQRQEGGEVPADAVHDVDAGRPGPPRPRPQDGGEDEGSGPRRALLREHRGRPRRRRGQQPGGVQGGAGLRLTVEAAEVGAGGAGWDGRSCPPRNAARGESPVEAPARPPTRIGSVLLASFIGTSIEWYDFFLYGTASALVFNKLFFPTLDPM